MKYLANTFEMCQRYDVMDHVFMNNLSELNGYTTHLNINYEYIFSRGILFTLSLLIGELLNRLPIGQEDNMQGRGPLTEEIDHCGEYHRLVERVKRFKIGRNNVDYKNPQ